MGQILLYSLFFWLGLLVGILVRSWLQHRTDYSGTIQVTRSAEKTLYSLVLDDYPETIEFKKNVLFKVEASDQSRDRE